MQISVTWKLVWERKFIPQHEGTGSANKTPHWNSTRTFAFILSSFFFFFLLLHLFELYFVTNGNSRLIRHISLAAAVITSCRFWSLAGCRNPAACNLVATANMFPWCVNALGYTDEKNVQAHVLFRHVKALLLLLLIWRAGWWLLGDTKLGRYHNTFQLWPGVEWSWSHPLKTMIAIPPKVPQSVSEQPQKQLSTLRAKNT